MRKLIRNLLCLAVAALALTIPDSQAFASFNPEDWPRYCEVETGDTSKGYAMVEISGPLFDASGPDFHDVRVGQSDNAKTEEIPYDIVSKPYPAKETALPASLLNRGSSGKNTTATVDLGQKVQPHNHLVISTTGRDFIKEVTLEGSDDRHTWVKIRNSGKIADFTSRGPAYRRTDVTYDTVDFRYLRVTLSGGTGEAVYIDGIEVLYTGEAESPEKSVDMKITGREVSAQDKTSTIIITGGFNHLPVHRVELAAASTNFSRPVTIYGSSNLKEWLPVGAGVLASLDLTGFKEAHLSLPVTAEGYRYLKIIMNDGDSPPVKITGVTGFFYPRYFLFPCQEGYNYGIYFGNVSAKAPSYDIADFSSKVLETNPPVWKLSSSKVNPLFKEKPKVVPESEKHKWLLPGILAVLVAGLAVVIIKSLPKVMKGDE